MFPCIKTWSVDVVANIVFTGLYPNGPIQFFALWLDRKILLIIILRRLSFRFLFLSDYLVSFQLFQNKACFESTAASFFLTCSLFRGTNLVLLKSAGLEFLIFWFCNQIVKLSFPFGLLCRSCILCRIALRLAVASFFYTFFLSLKTDTNLLCYYLIVLFSGFGLCSLCLSVLLSYRTTLLLCFSVSDLVLSLLSPAFSPLSLCHLRQLLFCKVVGWICLG